MEKVYGGIYEGRSRSSEAREKIVVNNRYNGRANLIVDGTRMYMCCVCCRKRGWNKKQSDAVIMIMMSEKMMMTGDWWCWVAVGWEERR